MEYTKAPINILTLSINEIQKAVDAGIVNYETIARIYLERIHEYSDEFSAIISVNENIIEQAKKLDVEYKRNGRTSMLFGIPIILKDNIDYVGLPTTAGAKALKDNYPKSNSQIVQNLLDAGALIIAKANMSEFAFSASLSRSSYGTVKNAYDVTCTSYGSSGGTATAVSTGMAVVGVGTDTNSSIRVPASAANLVGLRPTYNLLSGEGIIKYDASRDVAGPMTKYTSDNAILLDAMLGNINNLTKYDKSVNGITIGVVSQFVEGDSRLAYTNATDETDATILEMFNKTIEKLEQSGADIVYLDNIYNVKSHGYYGSTIGGWTMCYFFNKYIKNTNGKIRSFQALVNENGYIQDLEGYAERCDDSIELFNSYSEKHEEYEGYILDQMAKYNVDVLAYPTTKNLIPSVKNAYVTSSSFAISPLTGMPAISVPMGFNEDNMPYGIEFVAKKNNESLLYTISSVLVNEEEFIVSKLTPNLYEIDDDVTKLVELYTENKEKLKTKEYIDINQEIQEFFQNYNSYDNEEQVAIMLMEKYNQIEIQAKEKQKVRRSNMLKVGLIAIGILIAVTVIKAKIKKSKKKRKNKNRKKIKNENTSKNVSRKDTKIRKNRQINRVRK